MSETFKQFNIVFFLQTVSLVRARPVSVLFTASSPVPTISLGIVIIQYIQPFDNCSMRSSFCQSYYIFPDLSLCSLSEILKTQKRIKKDIKDTLYSHYPKITTDNILSKILLFFFNKDNTGSCAASIYFPVHITHAPVLATYYFAPCIQDSVGIFPH